MAPGSVWFLRASIPLMFGAAMVIGHKQTPLPSQQCPWIEAEQKHTEDRIEGQQETGNAISPFLITASPLFPQSNASAQSPEGKRECEQPTEEGTEFWPPFLGYKLKVTDTLLAIFTGLLFVATWLLWRATDALVRDARETSERQAADTKRSLDITKQAADAAKESADTARQNLIAGQRAWIRIDEIGLMGEAGASTSVSFKITNTGNSPAIKITPHVRLVVMTPFGPYPPQLQREMCLAIRQAQLGEGFTLFPQESFPRNIGFAAWSIGVSVGQKEIEEAQTMSTDQKRASFYIIGCIDYTFAADAQSHHQTGFILELKASDGNWIEVMNEGSVPLGSMALADYPFGIGRHAD